MGRKKHVNKYLLISLIIGALYTICATSDWICTQNDVDEFRKFALLIVSALVIPHLVIMALAVICNALGYFINSRGFALLGVILYTIALLLFPLCFIYVIPEIVLSIIGFAKIPSVIP